MKLQKQLSRRFAGTEYAKWVVVLPPKLVAELGWREGQDLRAEIEGRSIRLGATHPSRREAKDRGRK